MAASGVGAKAEKMEYDPRDRPPPNQAEYTQGGQQPNVHLHGRPVNYYPGPVYPQYQSPKPPLGPAFWIPIVAGPAIAVMIAIGAVWFGRVNDQTYNIPQQINTLQNKVEAIQVKQTATDQLIQANKEATDRSIAQLQESVQTANIRQAEAKVALDNLTTQQTNLGNFLSTRQDAVTRALSDLRNVLMQPRSQPQGLEVPGQDMPLPPFTARPQSAQPTSHRATLRDARLAR